jgi:CheY-like chemotaxis protein
LWKLSSELGKGSTFWITWPVSPPTSIYRAPGEDQNSDDTSTRTEDLQVPQYISVLLLTKNQVTSAALSEHLRSVKLQKITISADPAAALEQLSSGEHSFDMLISDSLLESSCIPVLRKCKERKIYVLMIVTRGMHRALSKSMSELSDDVITRPVSLYSKHVAGVIGLILTLPPSGSSCKFA